MFYPTAEGCTAVSDLFPLDLSALTDSFWPEFINCIRLSRNPDRTLSQVSGFFSSAVRGLTLKTAVLTCLTTFVVVLPIIK